MAAIIPRAEIDAVMERHGETCFADLSGGNLAIDWVRALAGAYREPPSESIAADLDALCDRYEAQHADAMWSHTDGINP